MDRIPGTLIQPYEDAVAKLIWIKVVGVGNTNVGKTCLIKYYYDSKFNSGYQPTVGVDYGFKIHKLSGNDVRFHLWDLSGGPEFLQVRNELYVSNDGIFLVFDVTNRSSFEAIDQWLREIARYTRVQPEVFIVGNKTDLKHKRVVTMAEGKKFAEQHKYRYFETSAATGEGVNEMFEALLVSVISKRGSNETRTKHWK